MGRLVSGDIGKGGGGYKAIITFQITTPGDRKGWTVKFDGKLDDRSIKWTRRAMLAAGWQGKKTETFAADVAAAAAAGRELQIECRIAHFNKPDGTVSWWTSVDRVGSYAPPLEKNADDFAKMDSWFSEVGDSDGAVGDRNTSGGGASLPGDDIPF